MPFDKQDVINDLKRNHPEIYRELSMSGELETMSADEILFLDASGATEAPDLSHISESDLPPLDMDIINAVMAQTEEVEKVEDLKTVEKPKVFLTLKKVASIGVACLVVILLVLAIVDSHPNVSVIDATSQETTDYAIRVRGDNYDGIFHSDFITIVEDVLEKYQPTLRRPIKCLITPVKDSGDKVWLTLLVGKRSERREILLTSKAELTVTLDTIIFKMLTKLSSN